jgi:hypothetical protein
MDRDASYFHSEGSADLVSIPVGEIGHFGFDSFGSIGVFLDDSTSIDHAIDFVFEVFSLLLRRRVQAAEAHESEDCHRE